MRHRATALALAFAMFLMAGPALGHGRLINFNIDVGGAAPLGPGLTETTFQQYPNWADGCNPEIDPRFEDDTLPINKYSPDPGYMWNVAACNPAVFAFDFGLSFDVNLPINMGLGVGYHGSVFGRKADPLFPPEDGGGENMGDKNPFVNHYIYGLIKLRILDMVKTYKKKWGTFDMDFTFGYGVLYTEGFFQMSQGIAYMFPFGNTFQLGLYVSMTEAIALNKRTTGPPVVWGDPATQYITPIAGFLNDIWMSFGIRMALGFADLGKKKKKPGETEFGEGESEFAESMKLMDSDGDGLSDYAEMMLGTNAQKRDSDGDTIPDGIEDANVNGVRDPGETNPAMFDTDVGGVNDGWEVSNGYDPLNPDDDDRDMDGILDDQDACPGSLPGAEVGSAGCETLTESVVLDQVTFVEGTAELNPEAYTQLDQYAMILLQDPELEVVIIVFGPPKGNKTKIKKITEEQADAIKEYLIMRGLAEERIIVSGEGKASDGPKVELQPIIPLF